METALWVLVVLVAFIGYAIYIQLKVIEGKLNGIRGLLSSDGPDPGDTSYLRMSAASLYKIQQLIKKQAVNSHL